MARRFGKYQLERRIGRGGMAEVWRGRLCGPNGFDNVLVVKRILPELAGDPAFVKMFLAEGRWAALLNHPGVVQVFEIGEVDGAPYLAMEHIEGRNLRQVSTALGGPCPAGMAALIVRDVAAALAYVHAFQTEGRPAGLVHRDVTPSNVMVRCDGAVKLLDFGISKALGEVGPTRTRTRTGHLRGNPGYHAPEQLRQKGAVAIDHRIDQFAAGVVLHELLTGRPLFRGPTDLDTLALVEACRVGPPSLLNDEVSPALDAICCRALRRDRDERYGSCAELAAALDEEAIRLGWSTGRLGATITDLFPERSSIDVTGGEPSGHGGSIPKRRMAAWALVGGGLLVGVGGFTLLRGSRPVVLQAIPIATPPLHTLPPARELETPHPTAPSLATSPAPTIESPLNECRTDRSRAKRTRVGPDGARRAPSAGSSVPAADRARPLRDLTRGQVVDPFSR
jgi:serine/threonine-protein kinase